MSDRTPAGVARITKTERLVHAITQADIDSMNGQQPILIDVPFDTPFSDLNYTSVLCLEVVSVASDNPTTATSLAAFSVGAFQKFVDKVRTFFAFDTSIVAVGDVFAVHVTAIHD